MVLPHLRLPDVNLPVQTRWFRSALFAPRKRGAPVSIR